MELFYSATKSGMTAVHDLLTLAQDCYAQAQITKDPKAKQSLIQLGDQYVREADELQSGCTVVQAAFPKPVSEIG